MSDRGKARNRQRISTELDFGRDRSQNRLKQLINVFNKVNGFHLIQAPPAMTVVAVAVAAAVAAVVAVASVEAPLALAVMSIDSDSCLEASQRCCPMALPLRPPGEIVPVLAHTDLSVVRFRPIHNRPAAAGVGLHRRLSAMVDRQRLGVEVDERVCDTRRDLA